MICQEEAAESMWNRFVDKQTKREYSNFVFERSYFYCHRYTPEKTLENWLQEMEKVRRNLLQFGFHINGEAYGETLLSRVSRTHRHNFHDTTLYAVILECGLFLLQTKPRMPCVLRVPLTKRWGR
eukprot:jgi/Phyca11/121255/e_gw1.43.411.1